MNGAQDLGGMQAFGPVQPEANEPNRFAVARSVSH